MKPIQKRSEKSIEKAFVRLCREAGWEALKMHGGGVQHSGLPDRLCLPPRAKHRDAEPGQRAVWCELKRPGEGPSDLQRRTAIEIAARGSIVVFADDAQRALDAVVEAGTSIHWSLRGGVIEVLGDDHQRSVLEFDR